MLKNLLLLTAALTFSSATLASSDEAWAEDAKAMKAACLKSSQLKNPTVISEIVMFDDSVGYSALAIGGRYPQPQMKKQRGRELCLWHRASKKAQIAEADTLLNLKR